ncbi:hypothetical protein [Stutzerimonas nitrititolerans]|uniref:hypothetical protein n=1 Tax=Stutzerimonas nitrititolerans TaxID=2482751 RepID=UPI0028976798|nr:hypothetical protein [Stutzerimonas nitrititolerans]
MRISITRMLSATALGLACAMAGAYFGINLAYDRINAELPAVIAAAEESCGVGDLPAFY